MLKRLCFTLIGLSLLPACEGDGSDIGPRIEPVSALDFRVLVHDDAGRPVSSARVAVSGEATIATTNRRGRARLVATPVGTRVVGIEGENGSATDTDMLGTIGFTEDLDGLELPYVVYLPDLATSTGLTLTTGTQSVTSTLVDTAAMQSGAELIVASGSSVGFGETTVTVRSGGLGADHLPGDLPAPTTGARLWGAGAMIAPRGVTFSPAAELRMPNDLGLAVGASAPLYHIDGGTGLWTVVATGTVDGTGTRIEAPGAVFEAGLYAFAVDVAATTTLTGTLLDGTPLRRPVIGALVRADGARVRSIGDGSFILPPVPATDAAGAPRTIDVTIAGGRDWYPAVRTTTVTLTPGTQDLGELPIETSPVTIMRMQLLAEGRINPRRSMRVSGTQGLAAYVGIGDDQGRVDFEDVPAGGAVGLVATDPVDFLFVQLADTIRFVNAGEHHADVQAFGDLANFWDGRSSRGDTLARIVDHLGTGPIEGAAFTLGTEPGIGLIGFSDLVGLTAANFGNDNQATAAITTGAESVIVNAAFTMEAVDSQRVEFPLERAPAPTRGNFDRHGLVRGSVLNSASGSLTRRVQSTRRLALEDWYDETLEGRVVASAVPRAVDPAVTGGTTFEIGVPAPVGNIAAAEGALSGGAFTLQRVGFEPLIVPTPGQVIPRDVTMDLVVDTDFPVLGAATDLHPSLSTSMLTYDLMVELPRGLLIDLVRDVSGPVTFSGNDATFRLPALQGALAGGRYYLAYGGSATVADVTIDQRTVIELDGAAPPTRTFLTAPQILSPAPNDTVSATGFTASWTVPRPTVYTLIELRHETASEIRTWRAILAPRTTSFTFRTLPPDTTQVLAAGSWTFSVTASRVGEPPLAGIQDSYRRMLQQWVGISAAERQIDAISTTSIPITLN